MNSRRNFLKKTCGFCVALGGIGFASSLLESCSSVPMIKASAANNKVSVPVNAFATDKPYVLVRVNSLENDILLVRNADGTFNGLYMKCTHQDQPLSVSGNGLHCSAHGSSFDLEGNVTQSPATLPLKKYKATQNGESIIIQLN
ncbi:MAG: Rieske (2Fe-2S) protein [Bacteroidia bacterium]